MIIIIIIIIIIIATTTRARGKTNPEPNDFQNLTSSSLSNSTSLVKYS